ncbi:nitroreductase family protein [Haloimpatiens sp. FM7330]|uniref:nitroreductase family protein n=1 Tax=Haloimpatiens sp. FM7330 TaxID=3298610 RepID=UPI00364574F8
MDFYNVIENRTSIRKFKDTPVDNDKLSRMINAAMMSPSWKNKSSYKFIIVDDKNKKDEIANTVLNTTQEANDSVKKAPVVAVVVGAPDESGTVDDKQYYLVDSAIAMEHFILAASNEGYGTCWIGAFDEDKIKNILNIPENFKVIAMTPVGEIGENKSHYNKKNVNDYVFANSWNQSYTETIH